VEQEIPQGVMDEILDLLYQNQKIAAMKVYHDARGGSLIEAKEFVERLSTKLRSETPEKFLSEKSGGCFGVTLLALLVVMGTLIGAFAGATAQSPAPH